MLKKRQSLFFCKWVRSIFDYPLVEMPEYIVQWLVTRPGNTHANSPVRSIVRTSIEVGKNRSNVQVSHASTSKTTNNAGSNRSLKPCDRAIEAIVNLIDLAKWKDYNSWLGIGFNVKSLNLPDDQKFAIFKSASQISVEKYDEGCVEKRWNGFEINDASAAENTLKSWARKGNPRAYAALTGETIIESHQMEVISEFVSTKFNFTLHRVRDGLVKTYPDGKYIIVNVDETHCNIINGEHDEIQMFEGKEVPRPNNPYIVIGDKRARLKCHNSACANQHGKEITHSNYTKVMKRVVEELLAMPEAESENSCDTVATIPTDRSYEAVKAKFEEKWFHLKHPTSFVEVTPQDTYYIKIADFKLNEGLITYEDVSNAKGSKKISEHPFLERWLKDPAKRTYEKEDFVPPPLTCPIEVYNLYRGLRAANLPPNPSEYQVTLEPMFGFMAHLCGESDVVDRKGTSYFISWLANIIQSPGTLPGVAVVIQSPQGTGKNMFGSFFGRKVLGGNLYESSAKIDTFFSTFAEGLSQKLLINFNEVDGALTKKHLGEIKEAITDEKIALERKNFQRVFIKNFARHLWFTNNTKPIHIEASDRRFVAFKIETIPDRAYFKDIAKWMGDDKNVRAFYDFLVARDLSNWDAVDDRPKTAYYTALKRMSLSLVDSWLIHEMETNALPHSITSSEFLKRFNNWAVSTGRTQQMGTNEFADFVRPYEPFGLPKKRRAAGQTFLPDLTRLRDRFVLEDKMDALVPFEFLDSESDVET